MKSLVLSTAIALSLLAPVANAGGSISVEIKPTNAEERMAIRTGLAIYSIAKAIDSGADITQIGSGNAAGIGQFGTGNYGAIHQEGHEHTATLAQHGNGHAYGIFQFGQGTNGHVTQTGSGDTGLLFQVGW